MEDDDQAERLEEEAESLKREVERLGDKIDDARHQLEANEKDPSVPGVQPKDEESEPDPDAAGAEDPGKPG